MGTYNALKNREKCYISFYIRLYYSQKLVQLWWEEWFDLSCSLFFFFSNPFNPVSILLLPLLHPSFTTLTFLHLLPSPIFPSPSTHISYFLLSFLSSLPPPLKPPPFFSLPLLDTSVMIKWTSSSPSHSPLFTLLSYLILSYLIS